MLHFDTLSYSNQSLLILLDSASLVEKQQTANLQSLVWLDHGSNPQSTTLETSIITFTPSIQWVGWW